MKNNLLATSLCLLILSGCGGGGGGSATQVGQFIDDPVGGLTYSCASAGSTQALTGTTDSDGHFNYIPGQTCTFKVGNVTLGSLSGIPADGKVTPQDVAGVSRAATAAPSALAIAQFLQSLNDGTTNGKIVIPAATTTALSNVAAVTLVSSTGAISQADLQTVVASAGKTLVSATAAQSALDTQIASGVIDKKIGAVSASAPVVLNSIAVTSAAASNAAGLTEQLTATGYYSDGSTKDLTSSVTWSTADGSTVSVDAAGLAKGLKKGSATVTASYTPSAGATSVTGSFSQGVLDPTPLNLAISYANATLTSIKNSATAVLQAVVSFTDATTQVVSSAVDWAVKSVSGNGNATVAVDKTANTATLTGTSPGVISTIASYLGLTSNSLGLTVTPSISGVAATGSAMSAATITLTDSTGKTVTTTAGDDGSFSFDDLSSYAAPYQLTASVLMGEKNVTHYSIVASLPNSGVNTVNVNQLTSAVVALVAPTGTVSDLTASQLSGITKSQVDAALSKVQSVIAPVAANITDANNFNPITSTFAANGKGPDALLDHISVNIRSDGVDLANKMAVASGESTAAASSSLTKGGSTSPTPLATGDAVDLSKIDLLVEQFKKCFAVPYTSRLTNKTPTSATLHADCQGIATSDYLHNGNTFMSRWAGMLNTQYADSTSKIFRPEMRLRLGSNPDTIAMNFNMTDNQGNGYTMPEVIQRQKDGTWKLYGNQRQINAFIEANQTHYIDLTPNTAYNNVNFSRVESGFRIYVDPRVTFNSGGTPTNQAIDLSRNDGTSASSWSTFRNQNSDPMIKCVVVTGPGRFDGAKWMGFHPYGLLLKRPTGSTLQDYMAVDSILSQSKNAALTAAQIGDRVTFINSYNTAQDLCADASSAASDRDTGGATANSNSVWTVDLQPLANQQNPLTGQIDPSIDGRDKRWYTGPNYARLTPDAALQQTFNNNPKVTFYVIDTDNKLRMKFDTRYLGNLPAVSEVQNLVTANKLSELSKSSITSYLDYANGQKAVTSVSMSWTNPKNGFNADRLGFYSNVYQSTPGTGLRGGNTIVTANKTAYGKDPIWDSDPDLAADLDALPGTNFYWRLSNYTKAIDTSGKCTGNYLVSTLNVGVARAKTSVSDQGINGTWLGTDTQATACKKTVGITVNSQTTYDLAATNTYLQREIWLRTYSSSNVRIYRYWSKKNIS